jgi:hypothetical protein
MKQFIPTESHTETIGLGAGDEPPENPLKRGMIQENAVMDWMLN